MVYFQDNQNKIADQFQRTITKSLQKTYMKEEDLLLIKKDVSYCAASWLSGERKRKRTSSSPWVYGLRNWQMLSKKLKLDEKSSTYLKLCVV